MNQLRIPSLEDLDELKKVVEFTAKEKAYFNDLERRRDSSYQEMDYSGKADFYLQSLRSVRGRFGKRIAVERVLKYLIGHAYEYMGTHGISEQEPLKRAEMLEIAVLWYQAADETVGFFTDFALRQAQSCLGISSNRKKAGLEGEVTEDFYQRGIELIGAVLGNGGKNRVVLKHGSIPEYLKQTADKTIGDVARAYLFEGPNPN